MLFLQLLLTLVLLVVCSFAPGFFFVRRLRWSGLEKLCGSIALSLVLLWLASWGIYILAPPVAYFGLAAVCVLPAMIVAKDARRLFAGLRVRRAIYGFSFLLAWTLLVLAIIRNYSGALWGGDWMEHFQRSLFFLHHFPKDTPIIGNYLLPARPPMMNALAAFFLGVAGDRFEIFQLIFTFFNLLVLLPCCLVLRVLARVRRVRLLPLVGLFAMNPAVMQNATYTWTKLLTAFFVILALSLYLSAWRKRDSIRMTAAFIALAAGLLVHYSAGPYVVFFAVHYLLVVFRTRPAKWKELAAISVASGLLLFTWFGWSTATYGLKGTLASNTSITASQQYEGSNAGKIAGNIIDSLRPRALYDPTLIPVFDQPYELGSVRDRSFVIYQTNLIFCMGAIGGPLVLWFVIAAFRTGEGRGAERNFWWMLIGFSLLIGLAVVGERDYFGVAHLTLLPMELLGVTLLAARFFTSRLVKWLIVAGCAFDFTMGVLLQTHIQHLDNNAEHTYFTGLTFSDAQGQFQIGAPGPESLHAGAWGNWIGKHQLILNETWSRAGEAFHNGDPAFEPAKANLRASQVDRLKEDEVYWHGWYRRHGGEITMLGDHLGDSEVPTAILVLVAIGLLWKMAQAAPPLSAAIAAKPKSSRSRYKR